MDENTNRNNSSFQGYELDKRSNQVSKLSDVSGGWMLAHGMPPEIPKLMQLWNNWSIVLGNDLSQRAFPLSYTDNILVIGAEDSYILSEISYERDEILARINAFLDPIFEFKKIEFTLILGQKTLLEPAIPLYFKELS